MSYDRNAEQTRRRAARRARGLCTMEACPDAPAEGRTLCQRHLDANREAVDRYRGQARKERPVRINLAAIAAAVGLAAGATTPLPLPDELEELRQQCAGADLLELGDILFRARTPAAVRIITDEINRRMNR